MPIDIATGDVELDRDDFVLTGRVLSPPDGPVSGTIVPGFTWVRHYRSALCNEVGSPLGRGWTASCFSSLKPLEQAWEFSHLGVINIFPDPDSRLEMGDLIRLRGAFLELARQRDSYIVTKWDVDSGDIQRFIFTRPSANETLPLVSIENACGDGIDLIRDVTGRLITIRQKTQDRAILLNYSQTGLISSIALIRKDGSLIELLRYEYDEARRLSAAFDAQQLANRYEYDADSRISREILKDGAVYSYHYDDRHRCVHFTGLEHYNEKRLRFLDSSRRTIVTNSYNKPTTYECTPSGQIAAEIDPLGQLRRNEFDEWGRTLAKVDPTGATVRYTYDENGNRDSVTDPLGNTYAFRFDADHQLVSITNPLGAIWLREYDANRRLVATENPVGARWTFGYDVAGNLTETTDPMGFQRRQRFRDGFPIEMTDWSGHLTHLEWDEFGQLVTRIGPLGDRTTLSYDLRGNLTEVRRADGSRLCATYDGGGNLSSFTNAKGQMTRFSYGPCRRLLTRVDATGRVVRFQWGTEVDELDAIVNEKGELFNYSRDDLGRIVKETSFEGRERRFTYDAADRCVATINGNAEKLRMTYDEAGRLTGQILPQGATISFQHDKAGRIVTAISPDITVELEYDAAGRLVTEAQGSRWVHTEYDATDEVIRTNTSLGHDVRYKRDPNGRINNVSTKSHQSMSFEYDAQGLETFRHMPGGIHMRQRFDSMGRLAEQVIEQSFGSTGSSSNSPVILRGRKVIDRRYRYDSDELLLSIAEDFWGTTTFAYDPAERLLSAVRDHGLNESFEYDVTDNLTRMLYQGHQSTEERCIYGPGNSLLTRGDTFYEYDRHGQLVRKTEAATSIQPLVWEYTWDVLGQLRTLRRPDGQRWSYKYDAFGRRVTKCGSNGREDFLWDGSTIIHEIPANDNAVAWIIPRGRFIPLAKVQDDALFPVITDHLGTPREMLDSSGEIVWATSLRTWGSTDRQRNPRPQRKCPIRFQGQWFDDESGLHYNRYRHYDPVVGRFISPDPIELDAPYWEESSTNLYQYAINPVTWLDPLGLAQQCGDKKPRSKRPIGLRRMFSTRKAAREAAEQASPIGEAIAEQHDNGHGPHYHPLDGKGNQTHDHYYFPKRFW